eukprot:284817453_6
MLLWLKALLRCSLLPHPVGRPSCSGCLRRAQAIQLSLRYTSQVLTCLLCSIRYAEGIDTGGSSKRICIHETGRQCFCSCDRLFFSGTASVRGSYDVFRSSSCCYSLLSPSGISLSAIHKPRRFSNRASGDRLGKSCRETRAARRVGLPARLFFPQVGTLGEDFRIVSPMGLLSLYVLTIAAGNGNVQVSKHVAGLRYAGDSSFKGTIATCSRTPLLKSPVEDSVEWFRHLRFLQYVITQESLAYLSLTGAPLPITGSWRPKSCPNDCCHDNLEKYNIYSESGGCSCEADSGHRHSVIRWPHLLPVRSNNGHRLHEAEGGSSLNLNLVACNRSILMLDERHCRPSADLTMPPGTPKPARASLLWTKDSHSLLSPLLVRNLLFENGMEVSALLLFLILPQACSVYLFTLYRKFVATCFSFICLSFIPCKRDMLGLFILPQDLLVHYGT